MGNILVHVKERTEEGTSVHLESLSSAEKIARVKVRIAGERTILCVRTALLWPFRQRKDVLIPADAPEAVYVAENDGVPYRVKLLPWLVTGEEPEGDESAEN
ncbi:MAG: hypothetical protein IK055_05510 [Lachnospiraceae bacterium]|nr:hypothetical protein [Lachnospiraceae bacterium]